MHERTNAVVAKIYPDGIHGTLAAALGQDVALHISAATLDEPDHGLTEQRLAETDVLLWWGTPGTTRCVTKWWRASTPA